MCNPCCAGGGLFHFTLNLGAQREMLALGEAGYKEVTLLGQNIDAYGRDLPGAAADGSGRRAWTFTDLLHYVHDVPGIERIRFATSHPRSAIHTRQQSVQAAVLGLVIKFPDLFPLCPSMGGQQPSASKHTAS